MTASWTFVVGPWNGGAQHELAGARARKCSFHLTEPSTASFTLSGRHPLAGRITELVTDLHVLRRPAPGTPAQRLYRGRVGTTKDSLDADGHTVDVATADYRSVLARRILWSGSARSWTNTDQADIVAGLLAAAQVTFGGNLGITVAGTATGVRRDRNYEPGDSIGERIQQLSEVIDGFDWDVPPAPSGALVLTLWYPQRGADRGVVLEYGGLAASITRDVDPSEYANAVRVTGTSPEGGGDEPTPVETRVPNADMLTRPEGRWEKTFGESITTQANLVERAAWRLDQAQVVRPSYTVKLKRGAWRGPDHIWLGDTCRLVIMSRPRLAVDTRLRVQTVDIGIDEDGGEDVTLTLGAPKPSFARRAAATEKRLADLERR